MNSLLWVIDFTLAYPHGCTVELLEVLLTNLAAYWPGWPRFPWRVTRTIHEFLGDPPVNFHYLMVHRCMTGYAAHLVLTAHFEDRRAVLEMLIRTNFQIVGVLRVLLIDALRADMRFTKLPYIRDASGPENGHGYVAPEELETRRRDFQESIEVAAREFVRILELATHNEAMNSWILGRPLRAWAVGGDMPPAVKLEVQIEETAAGKCLKPCKAEVVEFVRSGKQVPRVWVEGEKALVKGRKGKAGRSDDSVPVSGRLRAKMVASGRDHAMVQDLKDRAAILAEARRVTESGLSQAEGCRQAAAQAQQGQIGMTKLSKKYNQPPTLVTLAVVRRMLKAGW